MAKNRKDNRPSHSKRLIQALKSLSVSATPLSSILPTDEKKTVATTSQAEKTKGTKSTSKSVMPQKLLLQITNPGDAPKQPKTVADPAAALKGKFSMQQKEYEMMKIKGAPPKEMQKMQTAMKETQMGISQAAKSVQGQLFNQYQTALAGYNKELSTYNTKLAQYKTDSVKNQKRTSQYETDMKRFMSSVTSKKKSRGTRSASKTKGSRVSGTTSSKGTRS